MFCDRWLGTAGRYVGSLWYMVGAAVAELTIKFIPANIRSQQLQIYKLFEISKSLGFINYLETKYMKTEDVIIP